MSNNTKKYTNLAAGHPEGWNDAFKNNIYSFYKSILDKNEMDKESKDFVTFKGAAFILKIIESIVESNNERKWKKVKSIN